MPDGANGESVKVTLDGSHVRVDARPARLVSLLKTAGGGSTITAQPATGAAHTEPLPAAARQATFRVRDDVTVEATPAADFVAIAEDDGGYLVVAFSGEITVIPGGDDRFALGAHEALVVPGRSGGDPRIVAASELAADNAEIAAMLDATAVAVLTPAPPVDAATPPADKPLATEETPATTEPAPVAGTAATATGVAAGAVKAGDAGKAGAAKAGGAKATPAKAASKSAGGGGRRKKGKKGRPQPAKSATKKTAAVAGAATAAGAAAASKSAAEAGGSSTPPPKQPPKGGGGGGGGGGKGGGGKGGGGGGGDDDSYEDTPRDKRFLVGAVMLALVLAVGAIFVLSDTDDDATDVASDRTTTTTEATGTTAAGEATTAPATSTTVAPTTAAPTTTARATTTTARATTTTAAPKADYAITPKSCVQNGNSITYAASVTNKADAPFDFKVDVSFKTADGTEVAKATATVSGLASGKTADFSATGTSSRNLAGTGAGCHVTAVDATPSG